MSRYIQEAVKPEEESKEEVREMPKAGKYSVEDLQTTTDLLALIQL